MTELPLDQPLQTRWRPASGRKGCGRDPKAGTGTCFHWWDGCPDAEKRGCYLLWARSMAAAGYTEKDETGTTFKQGIAPRPCGAVRS